MSRIYIQNDEIYADFEYNSEQVEQVKQIPGAKWHKQSRTWRIPIEQHTKITQIALDNFWEIEPGIIKLGEIPAAQQNQLTINGTSVELHFSYDPVKVRAVKQIPGVTWSQKHKGWTAPTTSLVEAVEWATRFKIPVSDETLQEAARIIETREKLIDESRQTTAELDVAGLPLLPYQAAGVAYAAAARRCFIADDMGLGKTLQAIATLEYLNETVPQYPAVIVCPATLVLNWAKEYEKWLPSRVVATIKNRSEFPAGPYDVLVVGYPNITAWENQLKYHNGYIFDESHYVKTFEAKRTKSAIKIAKTAPVNGAVLCLTGTPVTNRPAEYASQLEILGKISDFGGRWGFYRRYCNPPEAPIWMADFTHKPLGEVAVGDKIIGWDGMDGGSRRLREAIVLAVMKRTSPIVKVTLASGRKIRCTPDHLWISGKGRRWGYKSGSAGADCFVEPKVGKSLAFAVTPIPSCPDHLVRTASWIGGIYDGEGTNQRIAQSKSFNPEIYERICRSLDQLGFDFSEQQDGMGVNFLGGKSEFARFLAWCKPTKSQWLKDRVLGPNFFRDDIVSVENDGVGEVISLTTSTGNYFAWGYASKNCNAFRDRFGQWNISGHSNLEELNDRLRGNCYIRRTKDQVLQDLPPVRHNKIVVEGVPTVMAEYRKADEDIIKYLMDRAAEIAAEMGLSPKSAAVRAKMRAEKSVHLVRIGTLRRIAARAKMAAVSELVENLVAAGEKVVLAAHHREIVDELAARWGNLKIQGQMLVEHVERDKSRFQELPVEDAPVIVLSIQAAKTGHTLTASQNVVFVELPWTPADVDQTYSRCHRLGQRGSVTSTYVLCDGTIDEMIYELIEGKRSVVSSAVDGVAVEEGVGDDVLDLYLNRLR